MATDERQTLTDYLLALGASAEDLAEHQDDLRSLSSIMALRLGRPTLSLADAAKRTGVPIERIVQRWRAAGLPDPGPTAAVLSEAEADIFATMTQGEALFGRDAILQLTRVIGAATSRIADAVVSTFLVNIPLPEEEGDLAVAKANTDALVLLPLLFRAVEMFLRRHILLARRSLLDVDRTAGVEIQQLAVGFVDLVDSTALGQKLSTAELTTALGEFEAVAADLVTDHGGRVIKLIGDEVMYTAPDAVRACRIALALTDRLRAHPVLPAVRGGVAVGAVMVRDGDCFGPVVNLAARAVKLAAPDCVVVTEEIAKVAGDTFGVTPLPAVRLKGFDGEIRLFTLDEPK